MLSLSILSNVFQEAHSCCPFATKCDSELRSLATCSLDGLTYVAGQKMTPKSDPCKICLCKDGWRGQLDSKDFCYRVDCALGLKALTDMKRGCQPIYKDGVCCPIDWVSMLYNLQTL